MNAIRNVFNAFANLTASINALAGVLDVATGKLRQQLALDEASLTVLEHDAASGDNAETNGTNGTARSRKAKAGA